MRRESLWSAGLILLICVLSFGVQMPKFGFYWDDYASMYVYLKAGSGVFTDWSAGQARPIAGVLSTLMWDTAGMHALRWHGVHLVLYAASVLLFWRILRVIWNEHKAQTTLIALLFAVYPSYHLRPIPISFELIVSLVIFLLSFWLSLLAARQRSLALSFAAALLIPVYQLTYEQNIAFEALRPLAMLYVMGGWREWRPCLKLWLPYPALVVGVLVYRFILFEPNTTYADYNVPIYLDSVSGWLLMLKRSVTAPVDMLIIDWFHMPWRLFAGDGVDADLPGLLASVGVTACLLYLWRFPGGNFRDKNAILAVSGFGLVMIGLLLFSVHMVGRALQDGFNSRWSLSPSLLAALILGLGIPYVLRSYGQLALVGLIVLGLAVQVGVNQTYIQDWELRRDLGWQMRWRAPNVAPGTMIVLVTESDAFAFGRGLTDYELTAHSNLYYGGGSYPVVVAGDTGTVRNLFRNNRQRRGDDWSQVISGTTIIYRDWAFDIGKLLVFGYDGGCLRTANPQNAIQSMPDETFASFALYHHSRQILDHDPVENTYQFVVEPEPAPDWCFYYQRIQHALQFDHDAEAARLADEARTRGFFPLGGDEIEWLPFIDAYNRVGRYADAEPLVTIVAFSDQYAQDALCEQLQRSANPLQRTQIDLLPRCEIPES